VKRNWTLQQDFLLKQIVHVENLFKFLDYDLLLILLGEGDDVLRGNLLVESDFCTVIIKLDRKLHLLSFFFEACRRKVYNCIDGLLVKRHIASNTETLHHHAQDVVCPQRHLSVCKRQLKTDLWLCWYQLVSLVPLSESTEYIEFVAFCFKILNVKQGGHLFFPFGNFKNVNAIAILQLRGFDLVVEINH